MTIEDQPWFVATDICKLLYTMNGSNASHFTRSLDEVEKLRGNRIPGKGGFSPLLISESGLYKLIMRSDKPTAKDFQDWVTKEVLPSIRKTGSYSHQQITSQKARFSHATRAAKGSSMDILIPSWSHHASIFTANRLRSIVSMVLRRAVIKPTRFCLNAPTSLPTHPDSGRGRGRGRLPGFYSPLPELRTQPP